MAADPETDARLISAEHDYMGLHDSDDALMWSLLNDIVARIG